jgi:hypothetical protein
MWLTTVAWASRISLSVNLWWPVVGFVDFVMDFGWVVVVGGEFFLLIGVGFGVGVGWVSVVVGCGGCGFRGWWWVFFC